MKRVTKRAKNNKAHYFNGTMQMSEADSVGVLDPHSNL